MRLRLLDYVGNLGGGIRFSTELISALMHSGEDIELELCSHGEPLERYVHMLEGAGIPFRRLDIEPLEGWRNRPRKLWNLPRTTRLMRLLGHGDRWHIAVPERAFEGCDVVLMPWLHRHRLPERTEAQVVASFHDAILFQFPGILADRFVAEERESLRGWVANPDVRIVVSSNATIATLRGLFGVEAPRFDLVPVSGEHLPALPEAMPGPEPWNRGPYLLCPANTFPHKNHEVLFEGFSRWGAKHPLVISGEGTLMQPPRTGRNRVLRGVVSRLGLRMGENLIPLGYIDNARYFSLLSHCRALVMPTRAEGGGSFPVFEAMNAGIPVVCSRIPVMVEQMERTGGEVLWFDVDDPGDLARALRELEDDYPRHKERAMRQKNQMRERSWQEVAREYRHLLAASSGSDRAAIHPLQRILT